MKKEAILMEFQLTNIINHYFCFGDFGIINSIKYINNLAFTNQQNLSSGGPKQKWRVAFTVVILPMSSHLSFALHSSPRDWG